MRLTLLLLAFLSVAYGHDTLLSAQEPTFKFQSAGVKLPGPGFSYDASIDVLDWNLDGKQDLFLLATGTVGGVVNFNEGTSTEPRFGHAVYYPFNSTETFPQTVEHVSAYTFCDLDHNGLFDIIFFDGQLRYCPNTGTASGPFHWKLWQDDPMERSKFFPGTDKFVKENARFSTGPESMYWNKGIFARQVLTLTAADWDGDGLQDLLISRFKDEAPGVKPLGTYEQWTAWGRTGTQVPEPGTGQPNPEFLAPLKAAPGRGLYFYKNQGTKERPKFDDGVEITTADGKSIDAPNPIAVDLDGTGTLSIISSEVPYSCNAFRVDWPTNPHVIAYRRVAKENLLQVQPAQPLLAGGQPLPAGTAARLADFRSIGKNDLLVMQPGGTVQWYVNEAKDAKSPVAFAKAKELRGTDFLRFDFMAQPVVVDWFAPGSRDLLLHGVNDAHCKWGLRRTALYRNVARQPGDVRYELAGYLNFNGDLAMVPVADEEHHYEIYGSSISVFPRKSYDKKRIVMSVGGRLYQFDDLADDGLTFRAMKRIELPAENNRFFAGWQEVPVKVPEKVQYIRIQNELNGLGNLRDNFLNIMHFEAYAGGKNVALPGTVEMDYVHFGNDNHRVAERPQNMFDPKNANTPREIKATTFGYYLGPAVLKLKEPVELEKIRFELSNRDTYWYTMMVPFYWQGKDYRLGMEEGENWYQYKIEVSADGQKWTTVTNRITTEMWNTHPHLIDWDRDGKIDLLLGVTTSNGAWPHTKSYRLYRNQGSNAEPIYKDFEPLQGEDGKPLVLGANWGMRYDPQCGLAVADLYGDGKNSLVLINTESRLDCYRNISAEPNGIQFQRANSLSLNNQPIAGRGYKYFYLGDVDGDGVTDLLDSNSASLVLYKGVPASAPERVLELVTVAAEKVGTTVGWQTPVGATTFDLRWSERGEITELDWNSLPGITGNYSDTRSDLHTVLLSKLPAGKILYLAVKSANKDGILSGISPSLVVATAPLQQIVLRNGPAAGTSAPEYTGTEAVKLVATPTPASPATSPAGSILEVRAQDSNNAKGQESVILIRFHDLPKLGEVERATLELTAEPTDAPASATQLAVSCNSFNKPWDLASATWALAKAGSPWAEKELERGGTCRSFLNPVFTVQTPRRTWDVTEAVRQAQAAGEQQISLLVRVDYTGHYVAGQGLRFCGPDWKDVANRPKLVLATK